MACSVTHRWYTFKCELNKKVNTMFILFCMLIFRTVISIEVVSYCSKQKVLESFVYYKYLKTLPQKGRTCHYINRMGKSHAQDHENARN